VWIPFEIKLLKAALRKIEKGSPPALQHAELMFRLPDRSLSSIKNKLWRLKKENGNK